MGKFLRTPNLAAKEGVVWLVLSGRTLFLGVAKKRQTQSLRDRSAAVVKHQCRWDLLGFGRAKEAANLGRLSFRSSSLVPL